MFCQVITWPPDLFLVVGETDEIVPNVGRSFTDTILTFTSFSFTLASLLPSKSFTLNAIVEPAPPGLLSKLRSVGGIQVMLSPGFTTMGRSTAENCVTPLRQ